MMASILGGAATVAGRPSLNSGRRSLVLAKAAAPKAHDHAASSKPDDENAGGRRAVIFAAAAAAAAACAVGQGIAMAVDEPRAGTREAKKKYAPVCVTMPTAKICHK